MASDTGDELAPVDTVFNPVVIENKITKPALSANTGYVYSDTGVDLYLDDKVIGNVPYKAKVSILSNKDDQVEVEYNGNSGFVDAEYILPLPVPEVDDVVRYFTSTLMLAKDPVERTNPESLEDTEGMFSLIDYHFEGGFKIMTGSQYESGFTIANLPGLSTRQAFLFASFFYESFPEVFKQIPSEARDEDLPGEKHVTVQVENGKVKTITVTNGEGCYWEDSISATEDGAVMNSGGGC